MKTRQDYSVKEIAEQSKNKTAMIGVFIMNIIIAAAYLIEVFKEERSIVSYAIIAVLCVLPCIASAIIYARNKGSAIIKFVCGIPFVAMYGYIMWTTSTDLTFCYIIVVMVIYVVYSDFKFLISLGVYAFLLNVVLIVRKAMAGELTGTNLTNSEIILACLLLSCIFIILAIRKVEQINKAIVAKAAEAGVKMTDAGATYPYGLDPKDSNIRIAPSFPTVDELKLATEIFVLSVKLVSIDKILSEK